MTGSEPDGHRTAASNAGEPNRRRTAASDLDQRDRHPRITEPLTLALGVVMAVLGAVIGIQLITRVGITPNSSVIGAMLALVVARIPVAAFRGMADLNRQNLLQTVISGATFGGANALLLPIGIPWLLGRTSLIGPMFAGALLALIVDATILYRVFDSRTFPATGLWPSGVATAEVLIAGDEGGGRARLLAGGGIAGGLGQLLGIPMDVFGVCWIGNVWALSMFAAGLLLRAHAPALLGVDLETMYVPHGIMIGAGVVALGQMIWAIRERRSIVAEGDEASARRPEPRDVESAAGGVAPGSGRVRRGSDRAAPGVSRRMPGVSGAAFGRALGGGFGAYLAAAAFLALLAGIVTDASPGATLGLVVFAAAAALISELVVGLSAMHAGWFPAFATSLIVLVLGLLAGLPEVPLALLVGFTAATGPAFADMGYDLKAGWIVRGSGTDPRLEREGRRQQYLAELLGFAVAALFVWLTWERYFTADLVPPLDRVYVATIEVGAGGGLAGSLLTWAVPGALIQLLGGPARQMGVLLATGLLILNPAAGWTAVVALLARAVLRRRFGKDAEGPMYVAAGGFIAGSAVVGFGAGVWRAR